MKQILILFFVGLTSCSPVEQIYRVQEFRAVEIKKKHFDDLAKWTGTTPESWEPYVGAYYIFDTDLDPDSYRGGGKIVEQSEIKAFYTKKWKPWQ